MNSKEEKKAIRKIEEKNLKKVAVAMNKIIEKQQNELSKLQKIIVRTAIENPKDTILMALDDEYESIIESLATPCWCKNLDGIYRICNQAFIKVLELHSKNDVIGKSAKQALTSELADVFTKEDDKIIKTGLQSNTEEHLVSNNGETIYFTVIKSPLKNSSGETIGLIGMAIDITKQKQLEQELQETQRVVGGANATLEQRLELVTNVVAGNHWWKDSEGRYMGCNQSIARILGTSPAEVIGKTDYELHWSDQADSLVENDLHVMTTGKTIIAEELVSTNSGEVLTFLVAKSPLRDSKGKIVGTIGNSVDITQQKTLSAELKKAKESTELSNKAKSDFIRNMEHDLRTPCGGMSQMAKLLATKTDDKEQLHLINHLIVASDQLLSVLNAVFEFSKIESEQIPIKSQKFDLRKLMQGIIELEIPSAEMKNLQISFDYPDKMPDTFYGDSFRIHRILLNLANNAIKFTNEGYVKISAKMEKRNPDRVIIIRLKVEDSGIGMPERVRSTLYEKYDKENLRYANYYGLGLRVVRQFTSELGGEIELESSENNGTQFSVILPLKSTLL